MKQAFFAKYMNEPWFAAFVHQSAFLLGMLLLHIRLTTPMSQTMEDMIPWNWNTILNMFVFTTFPTTLMLVPIVKSLMERRPLQALKFFLVFIYCVALYVLFFIFHFIPLGVVSR